MLLQISRVRRLGCGRCLACRMEVCAGRERVEARVETRKFAKREVSEVRLMELTPRKQLWIEELIKTDTPEGDGILWLVAALAQVCQEFAAETAKRQDAERVERRPAPPVRCALAGRRCFEGSSWAVEHTAKLLLCAEPMPLKIVKVW